MKSEPSVFSIDDLKSSPQGIAHWDGVRNYQARNMMRDQMRIGDQVFFYHSNCAVPGIAGIMEVVREGYPDHTAFDLESPYFDEKSDDKTPRWYMVDVCYLRHTRRIIPLLELKSHPGLVNMALVRKGNRLSVMPVSEKEWGIILSFETMAP